jgi:hypothetical protein
MVEHFKKRLFWGLPLAVSLLQFSLIYYIAYYHQISHLIRPGAKTILYFLPVVVIEVLFQYYSSKRSPSKIGMIRSHPIISCFLSISAWFLIFYYFMYTDDLDRVKFMHRRFFVLNAHYFILGLLKTNFYDTALLIVTALFFYLMFTIRLRSFRLITTIVIPVLLLKLLIISHINWGGIFTDSISKVSRQVGVETLLDNSKMKDLFGGKSANIGTFLDPKLAEGIEAKITTVFNPNPRDIFGSEDEQSFITTYGSSFFRPGKFIVWPFVIKKGVYSDAMTYKLWVGDMQGSAVSETSIVMAPWKGNVIYELSRSYLSTFAKIPYEMEDKRGPILKLEPMSMIKDVSANRIYIANERTPGFMSYDLDAKKLAGYIDFTKGGIVEDGGSCYAIAQSPASRLVYISGSPGKNDIIEIDPDTLEIKRMLDLGEIGTFGMTVDSEGRYLYYQSAYNDNLYKIDLASFSVEKVLKGELGARRMITDDERNVIYVLGYFSGNLSPIDIESGKRRWTVKIGPHAHGMSLTKNYLWVNSMAGAFRIDLRKVW